MSKTSNARRKGLAVLATSALVAGASLAGAGSAHAVADFKFKRLGGTDRYETASLVADEFAATNKTVILANGEPGNYADALSANTLAGELSAPILLTRKDKTPKFTLDQLKEDGVTDIYVVGGVGVVSAAQVSSLEGMGYKVTRVAGSDRFLTNAEVIKMNGTAKGATGLIATGFNFPDALAAGPISYQGHPLGLSATNNIEDSVVNALKAAGVTKVLIFGGESVVGPGVVAKLAANGITVEKRFAGADRSDTSQAAAEYALANLGFSNKHLGVASGYVQGFGADALAGGPLEGKEMAPMLVTRDVNNPDDVVDYMKDHANTLETGHLFGGTGAISASAQAAMEAAARSVTSNQTYTVTQGAATNTPSTGSGNEGARSYSVTGLAAGSYDIALFPAENVKTDANGVVTFVDTTPDNNVADWAATLADIEVVNGTATGDSNGHVIDVSPVNGTINFTVDSNSVDEVVPVVVARDITAVDGTPDVDLNAKNEPTEKFGIGGKKSWIAPEASSGAITGTVSAVDKDANRFSNGTNTFFYDANDTFQIKTGSTCVQVTMANFEQNLSNGDGITGTYNKDQAFPSTFCLEDTNPAAPTDVSANQSAGTVTISWTAPATAPESYNLYRSVDTDTTDNATAGGDTDGSSCQSATSSAYTLVKSIAGTATSTTDKPASAGTYCYRVSSVQDGDESGKSNASDVTVPAPAETVRPTITSAAVTTDAGLQNVVDTGDVWELTFSEDMADNVDSTGTFVLTDNDGDRYSVKCDVTGGTRADDNSLCALTDDGSNVDRVLTITIGATVADENSGTGNNTLEYPSTITTTNAAVADQAGNVVDLGASADKVVNK